MTLDVHRMSAVNLQDVLVANESAESEMYLEGFQHLVESRKAVLIQIKLLLGTIL